MTDTLFRQLEMLREVPRYPRSVTTAELERRLAAMGYTVDRRTIQRDLDRLSQHPQIALTCMAEGRTNLWQWMKDAKAFDLPVLTRTQAVAYTLLSEYGKALLPKSLLDVLRPTFDQSEEVLSGGARSVDKLARWRDKVHMLQRGPDLKSPKSSVEAEETIYQALFDDECVDVEYQPRTEDAASARRLEPRGIVAKNGVVYLVATDVRYTDFRHYALHRFVSATETGERVRPRADFDLRAYSARHFAYPESDRQIKLELLIDGETSQHLLERPLSDDQKVGATPDGRLKLRATVQDTTELRWWILGFGDLMEVVRPKALRREIATRVERAALHYSAKRG